MCVPEPVTVAEGMSVPVPLAVDVAVAEALLCANCQAGHGPAEYSQQRSG